ncbi:MAG: acetone carboxylase subunit gamma [Solirubrobacteraceae bacterium]|jgi:hypothetical protein
MIFERDTPELMKEVYPEPMGADPRWMTLGEYYCPLIDGGGLATERLERGRPRASRGPRRPSHRSSAEEFSAALSPVWALVRLSG